MHIWNRYSKISNNKNNSSNDSWVTPWNKPQVKALQYHTRLINWYWHKSFKFNIMDCSSGRSNSANNGRVKLPKSKAQKILQITQNITALLPNTSPSKYQVLLSLTMHRKTGSSDAVDTLHCLRHGISYSETLFVEDKWADKWSQYQT